MTPRHSGARGDRRARIASQLRSEISHLMLTGMKDPRVRLASISEVDVSPDLRNARVRISAIGSDSQRDAVLSAMRHAEGFLRGALGDRLENLRTVPRLHFQLDESIAYSVHISTVLRQLDQAGNGNSTQEAEL